jgi:HSP20 family molecular chaperone IbpA
MICTASPRRAFGFLETANRFWQPGADVHETKRGIVIKMELAGVTAEHIQVSLSADGRRLTLRACAPRGPKSVPADRMPSVEIYFGPFERTFTLPGDFETERDEIGATLKDGSRSHFPRRARAATTRTIPIEVQAG